ncbi:hypothetical protein HY386_01380 [Candidatus Daviesbacteria bacterium]|nr:hypothetical protein [Candidatus Daviesbacteria bacterium]
MLERTFIQKWRTFLSIIFSPGSIIPFILSALCLFLAISVFTGALSSLLSIFASILTAIAGFFVKEDWDRVQGNTMLEKKGRSAIRNLGSIEQQIIQIRNWIKNFLGSKNITERELKEIDRHLTTTQMNIKSGLEDWIDIVPELKKKEEFAKKYQETLEANMEELLKKEAELLKIGETNKELKVQLEKRIKELEKRVQELKSEQSNVFGGLMPSTSPYSFVTISPSGSGTLSNLLPKTCSICGKVYKDDNSPTISLNDVCPECKRRGRD